MSHSKMIENIVFGVGELILHSEIKIFNHENFVNISWADHLKILKIQPCQSWIFRILDKKLRLNFTRSKRSLHRWPRVNFQNLR